MSRFDRWIDNKIVQNLFVWFFLFLILLVTIQTDDLGNRVLISLFIILLLIPAVYINNLYILPFLRKNVFIFTSSFIINALAFTVISVCLIVWQMEDQPFEFWMLVNFFGIMVLALFFASALKLSRDSFIRRQKEKEAELKLLKAQLNPHFLFNTLNNLYGLSVTKSDKLPDLMLKLSNLLRYSLYETKDILVPLEKELHYLENYIALEKIRLEDQSEIIFKNNIKDTSIKIAPMLLIVFVENAFKHLNISDVDRSAVYVSLENKNDSLVFKCTNTYHNNADIEHQLEKGQNGIGLNNVKKRLKLLYPDSHELNISASDNDFNVILKLNLHQKL